MLIEHDARRLELEHWLEADAGLTVERIEPASADASFRRYFRIYTDGGSYIAMDAPPARENCEPFVRIAAFLAALGLNAPRVLAARADAGFLLLTDLGDRQYLAELRARPERREELYGDAIAALLLLQGQGERFQASLPPYDATLLRAELALFRDWLCERHLGLALSRADEARWQAARDWLVERALAQPRVFVHRDYHSRNLMVVDDDNPGILDFQDAVEGPYSYDLVSLLKDCYLQLPADEVHARALEYFGLAASFLPHAPRDEEFLRDFDVMGVQRHLKAAGIFARLSIRDGKDGYLADVPRTLGYVTALDGRYPELDFVGDLIAARCLPRFARA